jgi:hypothetical protein
MKTWMLALVIVAGVSAAIGLEQLTARIWPPPAEVSCLCPGG